MDLLDFRSDTKTLPTAEMREAIARAELGDDSNREDPTVRRLEEKAAERFGKEAALLVPSGTMANLVCLMVHAEPEASVLLDSESHIVHHEGVSVREIARLQPVLLPGRNGLTDPEEMKKILDWAGSALPRLFCLENTHNRTGGKVMPFGLQQELCEIAHSHGLNVHLDGARIFNASVASGVPIKEYAASVDSLMFCLSKGLSCPAGSVVVGDGAFIEKARVWRKRLGGSMRQAGIIAAAGLIALDMMIDRLADDHLHAKLLAQGLAGIKALRVCTDVETNIFYADTRASGMDTREVIEKLKGQGVLVSSDEPSRVRFVTHRHHTRDSIEEALARIEKAFE